MTEIFIDPTYAGTAKNGTIDNPFSSWNQITTFQEGAAYLFKRETTSIIDKKMRPTQNKITIGAYGEGERPILKCTVNNEKMIDLGALSGITIKDLELDGTKTTFTLIHFFNSITGNLINCKLHDSYYCYRNMYGTGEFKIIDCEIFNSQDDACFSSSVDKIELSGTHIHDVNLRWFVNSSESYSGGDCFQMNNVKEWYIHDNIIDHSKSGNKFCVIANGDTASLVQKGKFERNHFKRDGNGIGIYLNLAANIDILDNVFEGETVAIYNHSVNYNVKGNVFKNISEKILAGGGVNSLSHWENNTFYKVKLFTDSYKEKIDLKNNIFVDVPGALFVTTQNLTSDYNCFWNAAKPSNEGSHSIIADPEFLTVPRIKTNSPCIGAGLNGVDIGAFQFDEEEPVESSDVEEEPTTILLSIVKTEFPTLTHFALTAEITGQPTKVEFFANDNIIGERLEIPWAVNYVVTESGTYVFKAIVTDTDNIQTTSNLITEVVSIEEPVEESEVIEESEPEEPSLGVQVYQHANYSGVALNLLPGTYTALQMGTMGLWGNNISSIKTNGLKVVAYKDDNFAGESMVIINDVPNMSVFTGWNDQISSIKVESIVVEPPANVPPTITLSVDKTEAIIDGIINVSITASDPDGSISKIEYFENATKVQEGTNSTLNIARKALVSGTFVLTAIATDDKGAKTTSNAVTVVVKAISIIEWLINELNKIIEKLKSL